jgi:hypothetical protein
MFSSYMLILFTDFLPDVEARYSFGFAVIYIILIICAFNIYGVLMSFVMDLRLAYLKWNHQRAWKKYKEVNDKIVKFLLHDMQVAKGEKFTKKKSDRILK